MHRLGFLSGRSSCCCYEQECFPPKWREIRHRDIRLPARFGERHWTSPRQGPRHRRPRHGEGFEGWQIAFAPTRGETPELRSRRSPTDADVADGPAFRSDPRSRPNQSTGYWLKNVFSTRAMSSGATTCPCPSSVCRSVWGMAAVIAFAARSKKSVGRAAIWGSVIGPSVVTRTD